MGLSSLLLSPGALLAAQSASAGANPSQTTSDTAGTLQQVVVTATHVATNVQKTAIAMSVYGSDFLKREAVTDIQGLSAVAPDVNFSEGSGSPLITVRGISSLDTTENGDPAVTVDTDGFYLNRPYSLDASMYDIARVEVLRGPQGTLNGRNSVGGAINIITAQPTHDFAGYAGITYGDYDTLELQGMVNLPLSDTVQLRAAFLSASHDGYRNNSPQIDADDQDNKSARVELAFEPIEHFRGVVTVQYTSEGGAGDAVQSISYIYTPSGALDHNLPPGINSEAFPLGTRPSLALTEKQVRYNFVYDFGAFDLTYLGGYDTTSWHHADDETSLHNGNMAFVQNEYPDTINQELRATSNTTGPLQWQLGLFYFHERSHLLSYDAVPTTTDVYSEPFGFAYSTSSHSTAGYAQASYQLTDALKLTAGARYTSDFKGESGYYGDLSTDTIYANQSGSASSGKTIYHVGLDYALTTQSLLYGKVDTGYKAGGFNFGGRPYTPETVTTYEVGSKNRFFSNTLQLNLAAFYDNYSNQQVATFATTFGQPVELTENAGKSKIWGIESDLISKVPVVGTFNATVDYLHARYTDFPSVEDPSDPSSVPGVNVQLAGNTPPQAPTWSISAGLTHDWELGAGLLSGRIESKYQSSENFSFYNFPDTRQGSYTMSNAFLSYTPGDARWKATVFVKNLENSAVFSTAQESEYAYAYVYQFYPPRTYGVRLETFW